MIPHTGRPSRACGTCRLRRIKCDEQRPACEKCLSSGKTCRGYKYSNEADLLFRDQTAAVEQRVKRKKQNKACVKTEKQRSTEPIRATPAESIEDQALSFFIHEFVSSETASSTASKDSSFNLLAPVLAKERPNSALSVITRALSLALLSKKEGRSQLAVQATKLYSEATVKLRHDISRATTSKHNATLLATLVFGLFETVKTDISRTEVWNAHIDGAVALVKHRGASMMDDPTSRELMLMVRNLIGMRNMAIIGPNREIRQVEELESFWFPDECHGDDELTNQLLRMGIKIAQMRHTARDLMQKTMDDGVRASIESLLEQAIAIDMKLATWRSDLPKEWRIRTVARNPAPPEASTSGRFYSGPIYVYTSPWYANIWNVYRGYSLYLNMLIINCLERVVSPIELKSSTQFMSSNSLIRDLANDSCSSLPFLLNYWEDHPPSWKVHPGSRKTGVVKQEETPIKPRFPIGNWFLIFGLHIVCGCPAVPDCQKEWINDRLQAFWWDFGLELPSILGQVNVVLSKGPRAINFIDLAPPEGRKEMFSPGNVSTRKSSEHPRI